MKPENNVPDLKTLQAFAESWKGKPSALQLAGDSVHVGPPGQFTMAATILKSLDVDREVSSATIKADGTLGDTKYCKITDIVAKDGKLSFTRTDERSPWPIAGVGDALKMMPEIADLSRYMLTVTGLPEGNYSVSMDGKPVATISGKELAKGWNMGAISRGPRRSRHKNPRHPQRAPGPLEFGLARASKAKDTDKLAAAQKSIDECETKLQVAVQPQPIHFEIAPTK